MSRRPPGTAFVVGLLAFAAIACAEPAPPSVPLRPTPDDHERGMLEAPTADQPASATPEPANDATVIGVRLVAHRTAEPRRVRVDGPWRLEALEPPGTARRGDGLERLLAPADGGHRIVPEAGQGFALDGRWYDGALEVESGADGGLLLVNRVPLGAYLAGVLVAEMPPDAPPEALRAQAVLARSYALARLVGLTDSPGLHQAYHGRPPAARRPVVDAAVASTAGLRLIGADGQPMPGYWYHSTCGGRTTTARSVFGVPPHPAYAGVVCGNCTTSKYHDWEIAVPEPELRAALRFGSPVVALEPVLTDPSGRAGALRATAAGGTEVDVPTLRIRADLGPNRLRSTWITGIEIRPATPEAPPVFVIRGRGWGHGVGLCQIGAFTLARRGVAAEAILAHYYPGTRLVTDR